MIRGLYTSALGMTTQMSKIDVVSNNIANVDTVGYKKDLIVTRSFSDELMKRLDDLGDLTHDVPCGKVSQGVFVDDIYTDFSKGSFKETGSTLDIAIMGDGFFSFSVKANDGEESTKYGRNGAFTMGQNGILLTKEGHQVLGENGPISIPKGDTNIDQKGNIFSNGIFIDKLKIINITDTHTLRKYGDNLYDMTDESVLDVFKGQIASGHLETSNVNSVKEMIDIITVARTYEANQRMITIQDATLNKAVNEIARR